MPKNNTLCYYWVKCVASFASTVKLYSDKVLFDYNWFENKSFGFDLKNKRNTI